MDVMVGDCLLDRDFGRMVRVTDILHVEGTGKSATQIDCEIIKPEPGGVTTFTLEEAGSWGNEDVKFWHYPVELPFDEIDDEVYSRGMEELAREQGVTILPLPF